MNKFIRRLGEVVAINPENIGNDYPFSIIEYVDISSVGSGTLEITKTIHIDKAPSRAKRIVKDGDTILSTVRPNRRSFLFIKNCKPNMVVSTGFAVLRPSDEIDERYLFCAIRNQEFTVYLTNNAKGSAYPAVDTETIERSEIYLPPLPTQRKIAAILSAYDDLIENNTRRIKILEEMAQALYRHWFVDFKFPGHENVPLVDSGTELGMIPEGWEVRPLGDTCYLVMGQSPKSEYYNENGVGLPFHQGVKDFGNRFPKDRVYCTVENRIAKKNDILFSVRAPVGRMNIADKKIVIGRGLCAIQHHSGCQMFTFHQLREIFFQEDMIGGGTIFKSVTKQDMQNIHLLIPSKELLEKYEAVSRDIAKQIHILTKKITNLLKTRDLLLPKLISGELDVSELEVEAVHE